MALVILPGLNNLIEDISEEKKLPPNIVELALREALLKGYEKYRRTFYIGVNQDPFDEEYFSNFDVGLDLDEEGYRILSSKIIVEEVESEDHQISLVEVKQVADDAQIGDTVVLDVTPEKEDFGRMAASTILGGNFFSSLISSIRLFKPGRITNAIYDGELNNDCK